MNDNRKRIEFPLLMDNATIAFSEVLTETYGGDLQKSGDINDNPNDDSWKNVDGDSVTSTLNLLVVVGLADCEEPFDTDANDKEDTDAGGDP